MRWKQPRITVAQPERDYAALARAYLRGAITGATTFGAATYLLDPDSGRRRRAELRDRSLHTGRRARELLDAASRDLLHRARGRLAEGFGRLDDHPNDQTLVARVRAQLGHVSSHPRAIAVEARDGRVQLRGHVLAQEAPRVVEGVRSVRGVTHVDNVLQLHSEAEHIATLQGGERRPEETRWPPGPRLAAAVAAVGLLAYGARRRSLSAPLATTAGAALLVRSMTNRPLQLDELDEVLRRVAPVPGREPAHEPTRVAT